MRTQKVRLTSQPYGERPLKILQGEWQDRNGCWHRGDLHIQALLEQGLGFTNLKPGDILTITVEVQEAGDKTAS